MAIGIAIATALVNTAHVVGLLLIDSVHYRGGFAKCSRTLSMVDPLSRSWSTRRSRSPPI